jgi:hypothetical protein
MREYEKRGERGSDASGAEVGGGAFEQQKLGMAIQRRQAERARETLHKHIDKVAHAIVVGATLFQSMVNDDRSAELEKKLHPSVAKTISGKVLDKVFDKLKSGIVAVSGLGEEIAKRGTQVFGAVKSYVEGKVETQKALTRVELAQEITAALLEKQVEVAEHLHVAIDGLPLEKLLGVAATLSPMQRVRPSDDDPDGPERGYLRDGMVTWALENLLGLPAGDAVGMEAIALEAYAEFKTGVMGSLPVHEQVEAIQDRLAHPDADRKKLERAEEKMGPKFKQSIERDKTLRGRVDAVIR